MYEAALALSFAFFCLMSGNLAMRFKQDGFAAAGRDRLKPLLFWVLAICVPISLYSLAKAWIGATTSGSGVDAMLQDATTGVFINTHGNGYLAEAQLMLATCGALIAWIFRVLLLALLPLMAFVVFRAGTGGRGPFVTGLVKVRLLHLYEQRRRLPSLQIAALLVAVVLIFNTVGNDRDLPIRKAIGNDSASNVIAQAPADERFLDGMDFANLEYFEYLVYAIPQRSQTYGYFLDALQVITEPVPRVLGRDKLVGAPFNNIDLLKYGRPYEMTRSLPGKGWYPLGWLGVIIWCGLWGYVLGWIYRRFVQGSQSAFKTAAYMMFVPILIVAFRDGQLVTVLLYIGPVVLWFYVARFAGVPSAVTMRAAAVRRLQRRGGSDTPPAPQPAEHERAFAALPAAVRRRRVELQADKPLLA